LTLPESGLDVAAAVASDPEPRQEAETAPSEGLAATAITGASSETLDAAIETTQAEPPPATTPRVVRARRSTSPGRRPPGAGPAGRRLRFAAAGVLRRAEGWLRQSAAESERL
jgi:hypothetical protein